MDAPSFADGLGRRLPAGDSTGECLESLRLCAELSDLRSTQAALVARAESLSRFQHPSFAAVRRIDRLGGVTGGMAVVSVRPPGVRLSDVLRQAERGLVDPDLNAALSLTQQVVSAIAALHAYSADASHGVLGPERIVVGPDGTAVIVEYVLGGAMEQLQLSRLKLWELFRVAVPGVAGTVRFDQQTDVIQIGIVALSLLAGRVLRRDEFPHRLPDVLEEAASSTAFCDGRGLSRPIRSWAARALLLDARTAFRSAVEAEASLSAALVEDGACEPSLGSVQSYVARCVSGAAPRAAGAERAPRVTPSGSTLIVGPLPGQVPPGTAPEAHAVRPIDRGSGAHRVAHAAPDTEPAVVQVLADLSGASPAAPAPKSGAAQPIVPGRPAGRIRRAPGERMSTSSRAIRVALVAAGLALLWGGVYLGARAYLGLPVLPRATGTLIVQSRPPGIDVLIGDELRGQTPLVLVLPAGEHVVALRTSRETRLVAVTVAAGQQTVENVDLRPGPRRRR